MTTIPVSHLSAKNDAYWNNLVAADTGTYKAQVIDDLLQRRFPGPCKSILDIGCGTCEIAFKYRTAFAAEHITCLDYDSKVLEELRRRYPDPKIRWLAQDIFELRSTGERFDLIFLLDMLHEVFSFHGRPDRNLDSSVDPALGMQHVHRALENIASTTNPGGGIILTDDVLSEGNGLVRVRIKHDDLVHVIRRFLNEYRSKPLGCRFVDRNVFELPLRDFCTLLTQYNKISQNRPDRWNVERHEVHQYMSPSEYAGVFAALGFVLYAELGTPEAAYREWNEDFELVAGLDDFPEKRITLLAVKR